MTGRVSRRLRGASILTFRGGSGSFGPFGPVFVVLSSKTHNSGSRVGRLVNVHNVVSHPSNRVVRAPIHSGFHSKLDIFRCFVSARNTHGNRSSATLGATGSKCLAHHLISITRSIIIAVSSYEALNCVRVKSLGRSNSILYPLTGHVFKHILTTSIGSPMANRLLFPRKRVFNEDSVPGLTGSTISAIFIHSMLDYRTHHNIYIGYCKCSLSHKTLMSVTSAINIVTTRSVNRPNARLAVEAFRVKNATDNLTRRPFFLTGRTNVIT